MRKRVYLIFVIVTVSLLLVTFAPSMAKYFLHGQTNMTMEVGKFIVKINDEDVISSSSTNFILDDFIFPDNEYVKAGMIAPGITGYYDFSLDASESDVSVRYDITIGEHSDRIKVYLDGVDALSLTQTGDDTYSGIIRLNDTDKVIDLRVALAWDNDENQNANDTLISSSNIQIPITLHLEQYIGGGLDEVNTSHKYIALKKNLMLMNVGDSSTSYTSLVSTNASIKDSITGEDVSGTVNYSIPTMDYSKVGTYKVNYTASVDGENLTATSKIVYAKPKNIEFDSCNYSTYKATITCSNGIATLESTATDPRVYIRFNEQNYIDPNVYRYVAVRYKVSDSKSHRLGIYFDDNPTNDDLLIYKNNITNNGKYHEIVFDLWSNENVKALEYIDGLRFDFTEQNSTTMYIDYIKFLKTSDEIEYEYFYDFENESGTTLANKSGVTYTISNSILNMTSTNSDPMIFFQLDSTKTFDPKKYNCIYVKYRLASGVSTRMEFFMVRQPVNQTYAVSNNISGNGSWQTTIIDMGTNSNIMSLSQIDGWRFDPISVNGKQLEVDYIGISNRCMID